MEENSANTQTVQDSAAKKKPKTVLKLRHVSKKLGGKDIVSDLSFSVKEGEIFGFLGPNGAGKTTTIKMMVGLLRIDKGEIFINGYSVKRNYEKAMKNVGGIIENPEMYDYLSGKKNLKIFGRMHGHITKSRYEEIIDQVGLKNRINEKVKKYSLGMRQRLGIAQALLHKPKLLILDEPTNGLDPAGIRQLRNYLRKLADEEKMAILVSSHLLSEMELMCDRFCIIDKGVLIDIKSLSDIKNGNNEEQSEFRFVTDNVQLASELITNSFGENTVSENFVLITAEREKVAMVNAALVAGGVKVYEIERTHRTLEDEFIDMTKSEEHNIAGRGKRRKKK